jgi:hypothetical protein
LKYLKSDAYNRKKVFEELKTRKAQAKVYKREKLIVGGKMYALKNHLFSIGYSRHLFTKFFNRFLLKTFKQEVDESYGFFQVSLPKHSIPLINKRICMKFRSFPLCNDAAG